MRILSLRVLNGPNYWSIRRQHLIQMRLDLEDLRDRPTNEIPGFRQGLEALLPGLWEHHCSRGCYGGFLQRVEEGTWMGHVIEHVALELQTMAGMPVDFGRTRETHVSGVYNVVFEYKEAEAGRFAAKAAVYLCQALVQGESYRRDLDLDIQELREIREKVRFGPSTQSLLDEATLRGIPHIRINAGSLVQLGYGIYQKRVEATTTEKTSIIATDIACDKRATKELLKDMGIPVPLGYTVRYADELEATIKDVGGFPVVIKPLNANHGKGITVDIQSLEAAQVAYDAAKAFSPTVLVEKHVVGHDYRLLVINNKLRAVAKRIPAYVLGDGRSTIQELIDQINTDPRRGYGHENVLTQISVDDMTTRILERKGYTLDTVLPVGEHCTLKSTANLSTGGVAVDCTDIIHPYNIFIAERAAQIVGLDVAGIDLICPDITVPVNENGGAIVEINASPGLRMHLAPSEGIPRNVAEPIIDMLFPPGSQTRIPIIAVTGTNGKTTTTRLIAHIIKGIGKRIGFTTTDGVYIQNHQIAKGDMTGPYSARIVLRDPTVEVAVLETARGGILREGLGFTECDIAVVLNVTSDHLGIGDIHTLEDMARVKAVLVEAVQESGYAILNADDGLVAAMAENVKATVAHFSMDPDNPLIQEHVAAGGTAAVYEEGYISILKRGWKLRIEQVINIPLTLSGKASFMIQNALAATLATFLHGVSIDDIRMALGTFTSSVAQTPGRLNLFDVGGYQVLVDYAHNAAGYEAIQATLARWDCRQKIGVIGGPGDRRDQDLTELGVLAARMFDRAIVKEDDDRRGRAPGEVAQLIRQGWQEEKSSPDGKAALQEILEEATAIEASLQQAQAGDLVVIFPADVQRTIRIITRYQDLLNPKPNYRGSSYGTLAVAPHAEPINGKGVDRETSNLTESV
ncbi:MAG: cyanophycin synthetase [Cyanobacteriota bacterium]|nr:cyanophycin synthetase [Cyanobacteriota bacterium]